MGASLAHVPGDPTPPVEDLQVREDAHLAVPVKQEGPVHAQLVPNRDGVSLNRNVTSSATERIGKEDLTRGTLKVWTNTTPVYIGFSRAAVNGGTAAVLPVGMILEIRSYKGVFVKSTGADTLVNYISEQWTE